MTETILALRPAIAVFISMAAAGVILVIGDRVTANRREAVTIFAALIKAVCVFSMIPRVLTGEEPMVCLMEIADGICLSFRADSAGMVFACTASGLWILTSVYSMGYMRGHGEKNQTGYYAAFAMCLSAATGICFASNLFTFFIFYEILTVATYPLVVHYRDQKGKSAGRKYLLYTLVSGQLFFAGMVFVYVSCGTLEFEPGGFIGESMSNDQAALAFFLLILGGMVKAGVMPLHSWLPAAMVAPTPASALLHAVAVVKAGAFCVIRLVGYTFGPDLCENCGAADLLACFAAVTILLASLIAMRKDNLKARLAFSTVGQLSYILLGVSILTPESMAGALYHIVAHAFLKITLFMCAGAIFVTAHKSKVSDMRGIGRKMPLTMAVFTAASLGISGLPFMAGFVSKMSIMEGAAEKGEIFFILTLAASALLSLTYLLPVGYAAFAGKKVNPEFASADFSLTGEADLTMLIPLIATACISVALGIMPDLGVHFMELAQNAAAAVFGEV